LTGDFGPAIGELFEIGELLARCTAGWRFARNPLGFDWRSGL